MLIDRIIIRVPISSSNNLQFITCKLNRIEIENSLFCLNKKKPYFAYSLMLRRRMIDVRLDDGYVLPSPSIGYQLQQDDANHPLPQHFRPIQLHFLHRDYSYVPLMLQPPYIDRLATFDCMMLNHHTNMAYWPNQLDPFHFVGNLCQNWRPPDLNTSNPLCLRAFVVFNFFFNASIYLMLQLFFFFFFGFLVSSLRNSLSTVSIFHSYHFPHSIDLIPLCMYSCVQVKEKKNDTNSCFVARIQLQNPFQ